MPLWLAYNLLQHICFNPDPKENYFRKETHSVSVRRIVRLKTANRWQGQRTRARNNSKVQKSLDEEGKTCELVMVVDSIVAHTINLGMFAEQSSIWVESLAGFIDWVRSLWRRRRVGVWRRTNKGGRITKVRHRRISNIGGAFRRAVCPVFVVLRCSRRPNIVSEAARRCSNRSISSSPPLSIHICVCIYIYTRSRLDTYICIYIYTMVYVQELWKISSPLFPQNLTLGRKQPRKISRAHLLRKLHRENSLVESFRSLL